MPRRVLKSDSLRPGTVLPILAAIGVAGSLYGAVARPVFGTWLTLFSSVVVFSGTVQFTIVALLVTGAGPLAVLGATFMVNVRNFALGGALRPHLTDPGRSDRILLRVGVGAYLSWIVGTVLGVTGGAALGLAGLAEAIFPVLFIGLAALMVRSVGAAARAVLGAFVTLVLLLVWPGLEGLAPVIGGLLVAIPGGRP